MQCPLILKLHSCCHLPHHQVILWTLDDGNTVNSLELDLSSSECYYFERLERVLATQVLYGHYSLTLNFLSSYH